jgi:hypothetical protein
VSLNLGWRSVGAGTSKRLSDDSSAGWITQNANYERTIEKRLDGHALDAVGVVLQMGANDDAHGKRRIGYGVVDLVLKLRGTPERRFTHIRDGTTESYLPTNGREVVGVEVFERYSYGIVDVCLIFDDGSPSERVRAFPSHELADYRYDGKDKGGKQRVFKLPPGRKLSGVAVREQGNYGLIDMRLW